MTSRRNRYVGIYFSMLHKSTRLVLRCAVNAARGSAWWQRVLHSFLRDQSGSYLIISGFLMPVLIETAGLGTEVGLWLYKRQTLQSAADSAAISAATLYYYRGSAANFITEADGVAASYGFVDGVNGVTVSVNQPPTSGNYTTTPGAVEVIVHQPQSPLLSTLWKLSQINIRARAVAIPRTDGNGCVVTLNNSASGAVTLQGTANVTLTGCALYDDSNSSSALKVGGSSALTADSVNVVGDISTNDNISTPKEVTGASPIADPYAMVSPGSAGGCTFNKKFNINKDTTLSPGTYCGDLQITGGTVTLIPVHTILRGPASL
jgi:Flp pilus assembly protein TadG